MRYIKLKEKGIKLILRDSVINTLTLISHYYLLKNIKGDLKTVLFEKSDLL